MGRNRGKTKPQKTGAVPPLPEPRTDIKSDSGTPVFCLNYLHKSHCVKKLTVAQRADFATALEARSSMTWNQLKFESKHGYGSERMPTKQIKLQLPARFQDQDSVLVFRYSDKLPMVGVRVGDVFHILFIEAKFGNVYNH